MPVMSPFKLLPYLRRTIKDYNFWPASESDSPLKVVARDGVIANEVALKLDAPLRRKAHEDDTAYQFPLDRTVTTVSFENTFQTQISTAVANVQTAKTDYDTDPTTFPGLEATVETVELLVQSYAAMKDLANTRIIEVSTPSEPLVTLIICGEWSYNDETITVALTTLVTRT